LLKKGFTPAEGDHHFYLFFLDGKVVAKIKVSHNDQEIGDSLISKMYRQCRINKSEFFDLINFPLDKQGYIKILKDQGII